MNAPNLTRRLSAILSADVEGYSRLMREDEEATVQTITAYRTAMTHLIQQYRGRVVDSPGDNVLAEFTSVVDAVNCGVEIQRELAERNAELPEGRRMRFRIGINLGDVLQEGERIYGDGVNIAARMETLAEAGGIALSGTVYDAIENKIGLEYEYLGEQEVKNIDRPVRAYRVLSYPGAAAHRVVKAKRTVGKTWRNVVLAIAAVLILAGGALAVWQFYLRPAQPPAQVVSEKPPISDISEEKPSPVPAEPSIAVLPFANISGDPRKDYLSDGITEQIITALSKIPGMLVIARNSVFTYKGKPVMVQQVSEELGVRYVLEGSVQRSGDRLRITAQLIDAKTGNHIWSERYDRDLKDLFALQDDITKNVIMALQVKLTQGETAAIYGKGTKNLEAYLKQMEGFHLLLRFNKDDLQRARRLFEEAIELDPNFANAYVLLAWTYHDEAVLGWFRVEWPWGPYDKAEELAKKAISIDAENALAYVLLANVHARKREFEKALENGNKATSLAPENSNVNALYGSALRRLGRFDEATLHLKKAIRLDPNHPCWYLCMLGQCYNEMGQYKKAIPFLENAIQENSNYPSWCLYDMSWNYFNTGRNDEAVITFDKLVSREPENAVAHGCLGCALIAAGKLMAADETLEKALSMILPGGYSAWASFNLAISRFETDQRKEEIDLMRKTYSRNFFHATVQRLFALALIFEGKYDEALPIAEEAVKLKETGYDPTALGAEFYMTLGLCHLMIGENEAAISAFEKAIGWPDYIYGHIGLTAAFSLSDDMKEAQAEVAEVLRINPEFSLEDLARNGYYNFQKADKERFINALRKAGLK